MLVKTIYGAVCKTRGKRLGLPDNTSVSMLSKIVDSTFEGCNTVAKQCSITNSEIGFGTYIAKGSEIRTTRVGRFCSIGPDLKMPSGVHPINQFVSTSPVFYSLLRQNGATYVSEQKFDDYKFIDDHSSRIIGSDVWIGGSVTILEGVEIGDGSVIGAGALVTKSTPPYSVSVGVPAKVSRFRFSDEVIESLLAIRWWDWDPELICEHADDFEDVESFLVRYSKG